MAPDTLNTMEEESPMSRTSRQSRHRSNAKTNGNRGQIINIIEEKSQSLRLKKKT